MGGGGSQKGRGSTEECDGVVKAIPRGWSDCASAEVAGSKEALSVAGLCRLFKAPERDRLAVDRWVNTRRRETQKRFRNDSWRSCL